MSYTVLMFTVKLHQSNEISIKMRIVLGFHSLSKREIKVIGAVLLTLRDIKYTVTNISRANEKCKKVIRVRIVFFAESFKLSPAL